MISVVLAFTVENHGTKRVRRAASHVHLAVNSRYVHVIRTSVSGLRYNVVLQ